MAPSFFERFSGKKPEPAKPPQMVKIGIAEGPTVDLPVTDPEKFEAMKLRRGMEGEQPEEGQIIITNIRKARPSELAREPRVPLRELVATPDPVLEPEIATEAQKQAVTQEVTATPVMEEVSSPVAVEIPEIQSTKQEEPVTPKPEEAANLHRRFHIQPTVSVMRGVMSAEPPSEPIVPTTVKVSLGEMAPIELPVTDPEKFVQYQKASANDPLFGTRAARSKLIQELETPGVSAARRRILESQIRALNEGITEAEGVTEETIPNPIVSGEEMVPADKVSTVEMPNEEDIKEDVCPEGEPQPVPEEGSPKTETPEGEEVIEKKGEKTALSAEDELALREAEAKELAQKKERIGNKILGSIAKIEKLNRSIPRLEALIKRADSKNNPALGKTTKLSLQEKRLAQNNTSITQEEDRLKQWKADFLALGGTSEEIEDLILANSDEKPAEKPLVQPTPEIVELSEEMLGDKALLGSMAAGLALEEVEAEGAVEGEVSKILPVPAPEAIVSPEQKENLEQAINEARSAYVAEDVREMSTRNRLAVHFPWLKDKGALEENKDLTVLRATYQGLLKQYQERELEKIRNTKSVEERNESLESLIKYFRFDEALRLDSEYIALKKENQGIGGKVLDAYENVGRWYNSLSLKQKVAVGGGAFVGAMALSAAGGIGLAVGAPGIVFARRLLSGAGGAVSLDAISEKWLEGRKAKEEKKMVTEKIEESQDLSNEEVALQMQIFLESSIQSLDKEVEKRRKKTAVRKWTTRILGGGGGIILSNAFNGFFADTPDASVGSGNPTLGGNETLVSEGAPSSVEVPGTTPVVPEGGDAVSSVSPEAVTGNFPEVYTVTTDNAGKGLWGILDNSLPANLPEADRAKAVASLQNLIANKLQDLSPEEQNALGFRGGNINTIYPGETLKLQSLVSQNELNEIVSGKVVNLEIAPEVPVELPETDISVPEEITTDPVPETETALTENSGPEDLLEGVEIGGGSKELVSEITPVDNTRELLLSGRLERALYSEELGKMRQGIFVTPETSNWLRYSFIRHPEMGEVPMGEVLKTGASLPLHESQVERLRRVAEQAVTTYGQEARPGKYETIMAYTRRIATLGFQERASVGNQSNLI